MTFLWNRRNSGHLPAEMANRAVVQTTQAEFPVEILLWGKF